MLIQTLNRNELIRALRMLDTPSNNDVLTWTAAGPVWSPAGGGSSEIAIVGADTAINNVADVTIVSTAIAGVAAGDQIWVESRFTLFNNSGASRTFTYTLDFDAAFDNEFGVAVGASATTEMPVVVRGLLGVRSTSLAYGTFETHTPAATQAGGTDVSPLVATGLQGYSWNTTGNDLTGSVTVSLVIRSTNATATQTCRLHGFRAIKLTP